MISSTQTVGASLFEWLSLWPRRRDLFLGVIASAKNLAYLSGNVLNKGSFCIHVCAAIDHIDETHRAVEHAIQTASWNH